MKIVLLSPHFAPEFEGGTELVARAQALALARLGHEVRVISGSAKEHAGQDLLHEHLEGLPVTFVPRFSTESYDLELIRPRLAALLEQECAQAEVLHVHHWSTLTGNLVRRLGEKRPVVVSLHDLFVSCPRFFRVPHKSVETCPPSGWDPGSCVRCLRPDAGGMSDEALAQGLEARRLGFQAELDAAARVLVPSRAHLELLRRFMQMPASTQIMPHGLCLQLGTLAPLSIPEAFSRQTPLRVLFLGHRSEVKGVADLVQALAGLPAAQRACVHLSLLGRELEAGFDRGLRARAGDLSMDLLGQYEGANLAERVHQAGGAHLVALPSHVSESYGLVTDEAMGLGLPVWVSDRGAPAERVGESGKVLPAQNPAAWRQAFGQLLEQPHKLKEARRALPISPRTADNAALELEQIYAQLLSAN